VEKRLTVGDKADWRNHMDKIYYNGRIITMEDSDLNKQPEAVLVSGGKIKAAGRLEDVKRQASKTVEGVDLKGKCLLPSFLDPHGHLVLNGQMSVCADLTECRSFQDIVRTLREFMDGHSILENGIIFGFGYDHNFLKEGGHPDKRVLNQVSTEIPVFVMHISSHLACVNSKMLEVAAIPQEAPDPPGGHYGRLSESGELSGYIEEAGMVPFQEVLYERFRPDVNAMMKNMQNTYWENGITTAQDGASRRTDLQLLQAMAQNGLLKIDVVAYPLMGEESDEIMQIPEESGREYVDHFRIGGYKLVLDGSPQGCSAWMSEPYMGEKQEYCGYPWMDQKSVEHYVEKVVREKRQLLAHCNGDAASEQFLNAYEKALAVTGITEDLRPVMIHCQTVRSDQLERMAKLKMIASIFVGHVWYWGDIHRKNLGERRGNRISPVGEAMRKGVVVNFHQDPPVTKPKMLHSVWCAVNRYSRNGLVLGEDQKVTVYEALKAVTINAAYQYAEEDSKGSILPGKRADLVILDRSPLEVEPIEIKDLCVLETMKDGESIYKAE